LHIRKCFERTASSEKNHVMMGVAGSFSTAGVVLSAVFKNSPEFFGYLKGLRPSLFINIRRYLIGESNTTFYYYTYTYYHYVY